MELTAQARSEKTARIGTSVVNFFFPKFTEYDLFFLATLFLALPFFFPDILSWVVGLIYDDLRAIILVLMVCAGLLLSLYYAVADGEVPGVARYFMVFFAGVTFALVSILSSNALFEQPGQWYLKVMALYLFVRGAAILVIIRAKYPIDKQFIPGDAKVFFLSLLLIATIALILVSKYALGHGTWAVAASFVMVVLSLFLAPLRKLVGGPAAR